MYISEWLFVPLCVSAMTAGIGSISARPWTKDVAVEDGYTRQLMTFYNISLIKNHLVRRRPCQLWAVICHNSWVACDEWWTSETAVVPANEKKLFTPLFPSSLHPQGSALKAWINQRFHIDPYFHRVTYITHSSGTLISSWIILTSGWIQTNAVPLLVSHVWY